MFWRIFSGVFLTGHVLISCSFIAMSFFQIYAIYDGLELWWGLHWIVTGPIACFITSIPIVGTIVAMNGAVSAWDWSWSSAFFLFCGPLIIVFILAGISTFLNNSR